MEEQRTTDLTTKDIQPIETVLLVDDDDNWCFLSRIVLQRAGVGKQILTASNGQEAITKLQEIAANGERLPELVLLDIKMPVMDGFEFLEELSNLKELDLSKTKIFMCTSSLHPKDKERAHHYPVAGFVTKPLSAEILKDILK